jgi:hypothetical protein
MKLQDGIYFNIANGLVMQVKDDVVNGRSLKKDEEYEILEMNCIMFNDTFYQMHAYGRKDLYKLEELH